MRRRAARPVLPVVAIAILSACSGADPRTESVEQGQTASLVAASAPHLLANAGAASASTDSTWAAAIPMAPWTQCRVSPDGASSDDIPTDVIQAGADGEARFSPPPSSWGTKLILKCSLNGSPSQYVVDLNDSSTFKRESGSDLDPRPNGMRPALTGDLSAPSQDELLQQGYPPRPDPATSPQEYAAWVAHVSNPATRFMPVSVTGLGVHGTGPYTYPVGCAPWTGFIQAATNFAGRGVCATNSPLNNSDLYYKYAVDMIEPEYNGCIPGNCATLIWAGLGGLVSTGVSSNSLIQSGFKVTSIQAPIQLYWEYIWTNLGPGSVRERA